MVTILKRGALRCDARCYFALGKKCDCICGGENHGKGLEVEAVPREIDGQAELFAKERGHGDK